MMKCPRCSRDISETDVAEGTCPECGADLDEEKVKYILQSLDDEIAAQRRRKRIAWGVVLAVLSGALLFYVIPRALIHIGDKRQREFDFHDYDEDFHVDISSIRTVYRAAMYSPLTYFTARKRIVGLYREAASSVELDGSRGRSVEHYDAFRKYFEEARRYGMTKCFVSYAAMISEHNGQFDVILELAGEFPQFHEAMEYDIRTAYEMTGRLEEAFPFVLRKCRGERNKIDCEDACVMGFEAGKLEKAAEACRRFIDLSRSDLEAGKKESGADGKNGDAPGPTYAETIEKDIERIELVLAKILLVADRRGEAEKILAGVIEKGKAGSYPGAVLMMYELYAACGEGARAREGLFRDASSRIAEAKEKYEFSRWEPFFVKRALVLLEEGKTEEALEVLLEYYGNGERDFQQGFHSFDSYFLDAMEVSVADLERVSTLLEEAAAEAEEGKGGNIERALLFFREKACRYYLGSLELEKAGKCIDRLEKSAGESMALPLRYFAAVAEKRWDEALELGESPGGEGGEESSGTGRDWRRQELIFQALIMLGRFGKAGEMLEKGMLAGHRIIHDMNHVGLIVEGLSLMDRPGALKALLEKEKPAGSKGNFLLEALEAVAAGDREKALGALCNRNNHYGIYFYETWYPLAVKMIELLDPSGRRAVFLLENEIRSEIFYYRYPASCRKLLWMMNEIVHCSKGKGKREAREALERIKRVCAALNDLEPFLCY